MKSRYTKYKRFATIIIVLLGCVMFTKTMLALALVQLTMGSFVIFVIDAATARKLSNSAEIILFVPIFVCVFLVSAAAIVAIVTLLGSLIQAAFPDVGIVMQSIMLILAMLCLVVVATTIVTIARIICEDYVDTSKIVDNVKYYSVLILATSTLWVLYNNNKTIAEELHWPVSMIKFFVGLISKAALPSIKILVALAIDTGYYTIKFATLCVLLLPFYCVVLLSRELISTHLSI